MKLAAHDATAPCMPGNDIMPTYEYKCRACDHRFEAFQSMTEAAITNCPHCGKEEVERLISPGGGLLFKGSGFYITDYRKDSYKREAKRETSPPDTKPSSPSSTPKSD
jgi:putative FmdB family regulatory protein